MIKNKISKIFHILFISIFVMAITPVTTFNAYASQESVDEQIKDIKGTQKCASTKDLKEKWEAECYSCIVIATLVDAFMNGAEGLYSITAEAGEKLLLIGFFLWIIFWGIKHLGTIGGANGATMLWELLAILFKIGIAFIIIKVGASTIAAYAINPILSAGADYAQIVLEETSSLSSSAKASSDEASLIKSTGSVITKDTLIDILELAKAVSNSISTLMVVGSSLICFGIINPIFDKYGITISDFMTIISGALIWGVGFILSLAVCYYLLDIAFKLGIVVLLMPLALGLWPFPLKSTKEKVKSLIDIVINVAGLFIFLAITVSLALVLIDNAFINPKDNSTMKGTQVLFEAIDNGSTDFIRGLFDVTEPFFLIIMFCLFMSFKIVQSSEKYTKQFFKSELSGIKPMHQGATGITAMVTKPAKKIASTAINIAAHQTGRLVTKGVQAAAGATTQAVTKAGQRFLTPTLRGARDGAREAYDTTQAAAFFSSTQEPGFQNTGAKNKLKTAINKASGAVMGATVAPAGALVGGITAGIENEVKNFNNMKNRVIASGSQFVNSAIDTAKSIKATGSSLKKGDLKGAFNNAAQTLGNATITGAAAIKTAASVTKTSAQATDFVAKRLQNNKNDLKDASGQRRNISREKATDLQQKADQQKRLSGFLNKIAAKGKTFRSKIKHGRATLGDALSFDDKDTNDE